jgi:hypothetical protein
MSTSKCWLDSEDSANKQDSGCDNCGNSNQSPQKLKTESNEDYEEKEDLGENLTEASNDPSEESKSKDLIRTETEEEDNIYHKGFYDVKIKNKNQSRKYSTPSGLTKAFKGSDKSIDESAGESSNSRHSLNYK